MNLDLPRTLDADIDQFEEEVRRFQEGASPPEEFKHQRTLWGIYEQRRDATYMLRTRIPGGRLPSTWARAIAGLNLKYGGGKLHVSTRGNIQFHDLDLGGIPLLMRELKQAGVCCKGGGGNTARNVVGCPLAGLCRSEPFDVTPYVLAVTRHLLNEPGSFTLPRKFKVAFSGCAADCALATVTDVGFVARLHEGKPCFAVYGGGGMGGAPRLGEVLAERIPAGDCVRAVEAVRRLFARLGDRTNRARARLRYAAARMAPGEFRALFTRELEDVTTAGMSPFMCESQAFQIAGSAPGVICQPPLGSSVIPQRQPGLVAIVIAPASGLITSGELLALANLAERFSGEKGLRATPAQKLVIPSVDVKDLRALTSELTAVNAGFLAPGALSRIVACTGAATCRLGICDSREAARAIAAALDQAALPADIVNSLDIRLNGCPNCCGQHPVGDIGLSGVRQIRDGQPGFSYRLHLGARRGEGRTRLGEFVGAVPAGSLPDAVTAVLRDFAANRQDPESLSDYYDRRGRAYFQALAGTEGR